MCTDPSDSSSVAVVVPFALFAYSAPLSDACLGLLLRAEAE